MLGAAHVCSHGGPDEAPNAKSDGHSDTRANGCALGFPNRKPFAGAQCQSVKAANHRTDGVTFSRAISVPNGRAFCFAVDFADGFAFIFSPLPAPASA